ncbi:MAG: glycosyltransferase family 9 protein [Ignavibacteriaceae bacterium]|nr:glycosyltransferase family 9 protein [Ignavibacteriaceae bacterium]MCW8814236.1 glycosyltransferase family 9 protein [Chlorobium sp.]MCW8960660.1 glycosyltransferase family 9 protein [Ignavibacteriaceae bacterium]MCW9096480.1 glycosyltransferase family 9 protein [Ignavibacteriaceae bacterium]
MKKVIHSKKIMPKENFTSKIVYSLFRLFFSLDDNQDKLIGTPKKILVVRQHNQLGDVLSGVSLFRALKETFPESNISLVVSPFNYPGIAKNKFLDRIYVFDKKKLYNPVYFYNLIKFLREGYDLAIVPVLVSISFTSNLLARISKSKIRIGARSLNGKDNPSAFLFDRRVDLDWRSHPDSNVSERSLDIVRPFGINTNNFKSEITFDEVDTTAAKFFFNEFSDHSKKYLIGLHVGAGKANNRWSLEKYILLVQKIDNNFSVNFYLTGGWAEKEELNFLIKNAEIKFGKFINRPIPQIAALISMSDLFISNDTGIMHVAGTTDTPQISIFGPTNPFNWAPIGINKYFIRKSELIDDVSVEDVYHLCDLILSKKEIKN